MKRGLDRGWYLLACGVAAVGAAPAHAQQCRTDADCPQGVPCEKAPVDVSACDRSSGACDSGVAEPEYGECEPQYVACETDDDCPAGLICERTDDDSACATPPAGAGDDEPAQCEPEPATDQGRCAWVPEPCQDDADCGPPDVCTVLRTTRECSGGGQACAPGDECPPPEPDVCTETESSFCFARPVECTSDADCDADARCVELPEDAQDDAPEGWQGITRACFLEGIAQGVEGTIRLGGGISSSDSDAASGGAEKGSDALDAAAGDDEDDGGCAVQAPGARGAGAAASGLPWLLGWALMRCSRRARAARVARAAA